MLNFIKATALVVLGFWLLAAATWLFLYGPRSITFDEAAGIVIAPPEEEVQPESVFFLGDIMLARDVETRLKVQPSRYAFSQFPEFQEASAVVGNFEASVPEIHAPTPNMAMKFSVATSLLPILEEGHVTHLSLANNHALDHYDAGHKNTVLELQARGIKVFGHPALINKSSISYFEQSGTVVAVIGINATYGIPKMEEWTEALSEASAISSVQIAYVHWGDEYELSHSASQEQIAHSLIDSGFDMVIGHHPHVTQDIEKYNGALIFYSLGNFIFDQYWNRHVQEGLVLELVFKGEERSVVLHPVESRTTRVQPRKMVEEERLSFLSGLAARSSGELMEEIKAGSLSLQF